MTKLFLDLEETVIRSWGNPLLCNIENVKAFLDQHPDVDKNDVRVFSFAIYTEADKAKFEKTIKPVLERALEIRITSWPSVKEIAAIDESHTHCRWQADNAMTGLDICEFISIRGKLGAFENYIWGTGENHTTYILLDDIVPSRSILDHKRDIRIDFVNVAEFASA